MVCNLTRNPKIKDTGDKLDVIPFLAYGPLSWALIHFRKRNKVGWRIIQKVPLPMSLMLSRSKAPDWLHLMKAHYIICPEVPSQTFQLNPVFWQASENCLFPSWTMLLEFSVPRPRSEFHSEALTWLQKKKTSFSQLVSPLNCLHYQTPLNFCHLNYILGSFMSACWHNYLVHAVSGMHINIFIGSRSVENIFSMKICITCAEQLFSSERELTSIISCMFVYVYWSISIL